MGIEVLITGLCLINLTTDPPQIECPVVPEHSIRVMIEATTDSTWDPLRPMKWSQGLDGQEMFVIEHWQIDSIEFLDADGNKIHWTQLTTDISDLMKHTDLGYDGYRTLEGAFIRPLNGGRLEAESWIYHRDNDDGRFDKSCFVVPRDGEGKEVTLTESARWTVDNAAYLRVKLRFNGGDLTVKADHDRLQVVISNDVTAVALYNYTPDFKHWEEPGDLSVLGFSGEYAEPLHCEGQLTRKPICNLLVVE